MELPHPTCPLCHGIPLATHNSIFPSQPSDRHLVASILPKLPKVFVTLCHVRYLCMYTCTYIIHTYIHTYSYSVPQAKAAPPFSHLHKTPALPHSCAKHDPITTSRLVPTGASVLSRPDQTRCTLRTYSVATYIFSQLRFSRGSDAEKRRRAVGWVNMALRRSPRLVLVLGLGPYVCT